MLTGDATGAPATEKGAGGTDDAKAKPLSCAEAATVAEDAGEITGTVGRDDGDGDGSMTCAIANAPSKNRQPTTATRLRRL